MRLAQGGKFEHGFIPGFVSSLAGSSMANSPNMKIAEKIALSVVIGGTAEKLGGGKFANGAVTGAYVMMFNHLMAQAQDIGGRDGKPAQDFYYESVDEMEFPNGQIMSKDNFVFTFDDDPTGNVRYLGFKEG